MNRFDLVASSWDSNSKRVQIAKSAADKILEIVPIKDNFDVLDYGCGTGLLGFGLSEFVKSVTGMDSSKAMIEEFNKKSQELNFENSNAIFHDINDNYLPKNSFDLIVSSMTLHHIKDTGDFVAKSVESLRSDGYLCISDLVKEDGTFHESGNDGVWHFGFELDDLKKIFESNGMQVIFLEEIYIVEKNKNYPIFLIVGKKMARL